MVPVTVGVKVDVIVGVEVGEPTVGVSVAKGSQVKVLVGVAKGLKVLVEVGVDVGVPVGVSVPAKVKVEVGVEDQVAEGVGVAAFDWAHKDEAVKKPAKPQKMISRKLAQMAANFETKNNGLLLFQIISV